MIETARWKAEEYLRAADQSEHGDDFIKLADAYRLCADAWEMLDRFPVGASVLGDGYDYTIVGHGHTTASGEVPALHLTRCGQAFVVPLRFDHADMGCEKSDLDNFAEELEEFEVIPDHDVLVRISGVFMICGSEVRMSNVLGEITDAPYDFSSFAKTPVWITLREYHQGYAEADLGAELWTGDINHPNAQGSYAIECDVRFTNGLGVRCEHSACSQNYIDTGDTACIS